MPKVSVVIPNYNHARFLRKRIDSVLQQTFQDFEVILLDDCSTDDSRSILSPYANDPRVRIEFNDANSGSTFKQWNKGVRLARGEYIWIAESDDYADQKLLERLVTVLDADPRVVFVNCRSWRVDADGQVHAYADSYLEAVDPEKWTKDFNVDGREECREYFVRANAVCNASSVLLRKAVYERVGGADESLRFCGDWKLWASMALTGRVAYLGEPLNYYRAHSATVTEESSRQGLAATECLDVVRWMLRQITPSDVTKQMLRERLAWVWIPAMTSGRVPLGRRLKILWDAIAVDPHALRRVALPMLAAIRIKLYHSCRFIRERV